MVKLAHCMVILATSAQSDFSERERSARELDRGLGVSSSLDLGKKCQLGMSTSGPERHPVGGGFQAIATASHAAPLHQARCRSVPLTDVPGNHGRP